MAFKPNYRQQRNERDRAKKAKKEDKLRKQQERTALRRSGDGPVEGDGDTPADADSLEETGTA